MGESCYSFYITLGFQTNRVSLFLNHTYKQLMPLLSSTCLSHSSGMDVGMIDTNQLIFVELYEQQAIGDYFILVLFDSLSLMVLA